MILRGYAKVCRLSAALLLCVSMAGVSQARELPASGETGVLADTAARMRGDLERGAAADAVRLGRDITSRPQGRENEAGYTDIIMLQARGYLKLGMSQNAARLLRERIATLPSGRTAELAALYSLLSQAAILGGRLDEAEQALEKVTPVVGTGSPARDRFWAIMLKAHILLRQKRSEDSLKLCREAEQTARESGDVSLQAFAMLQRAQAARQAGDMNQAEAAFREALERYGSCADSSDAVTGTVAAAGGLARLGGASPDERRKQVVLAEAAFSQAVERSLRLGDSRSLSLAYGKWGEVLEASGRPDEALPKTLLALHQAQQGRMLDLLYQWQHQAGRILKGQKQEGRALDMYRAATQSLNLFKKALASDCGIADGSFTDTTKPVYLDLAALLIDVAGASGGREEEQRYLLEARATVETLRTEELRDYFEDACLGAERGERPAAMTVPARTALIYAVMFPQRLDLLVSLPDGIRHYRVAETPATVSREVRMLRLTIENRFPAWSTSARKLYDWLFKPIEPELARQGVTTIVFVPDGPLRNIPLTVLHDGTANIIQKYAIATIQGLNFVAAPRATATRPATMLMAGLSESVQGYPALVNVTEEVKGIRSSYPGTSLINSEFRVGNVKEQLDRTPYPLIHIASHGEFTGNSRNNYILTWDGRMTLDHLDHFIRSSALRKTPVELLSLSACKTAAGDDRASLGLAGLAIKSGARTAVASLWDIDDKSTSELFIEFYRIIHEGGDVNRAEALRQAQLIIRQRYDHPYFWSPFLLVGNWL